MHSARGAAGTVKGREAGAGTVVAGDAQSRAMPTGATERVGWRPSLAEGLVMLRVRAHICAGVVAEWSIHKVSVMRPGISNRSRWKGRARREGQEATSTLGCALH